MDTKYLIIGNAAGGVGAVEGIRANDKSGVTTVVSNEPYDAYSRPLIAQYLTGERDFEGLRFRPAGFYARNAVTTVFGAGVKSLGIDDHTAELSDGRIIGWDKALIATGGVPILPKTPGTEATGVFTFNTLDDAIRIKRFIAGRQISAVVIGGGLIGMSVSESLKKCGVRVTIIEMRQYILNTILDEEAGRFAAVAVSQAGVNILTGRTVTEIQAGSDGTVCGVKLDNGINFACELVVMAIGVRPNTDITNGTGIKLNRGILVNRHMATNIPGIFACGDAAEAYDITVGEARLTPIWPNAYLGGRVGGLNMAGKETEYPGGTAMNSLKYFGMEIVTAGITTITPAGFESVSGAEGGTYRRLILHNGIIVGMVFIGNIGKAGLVFSFLRDKVNVANFKHLLIVPEINQAALPEVIYRGKLKPPLVMA
jgi:NAD(P)H-nitrite reductase large subunit